MRNGAVRQYRKDAPEVPKPKKEEPKVKSPKKEPKPVEPVIVDPDPTDGDPRPACPECNFRSNTERGVKLHMSKSHKKE